MKMAIKYVTDRALLRFAEEVKTCFSFLSDMDFRCVRSDATYVRFESPTMSVNVYHGRRSFEIGLEIEPRSPPTVAYSFSEILRLVNPIDAASYRNFATHTIEGVTEGVSRLAQSFHRCVATGILTDDQLFSHLKLQRDEWSRNYALETQLEQARTLTAKAWAQKDYLTVVNALKPFRSALTMSEIGKLKFSEKKLNI